MDVMFPSYLCISLDVLCPVCFVIGSHHLYYPLKFCGIQLTESVKVCKRQENIDAWTQIK